MDGQIKKLNLVSFAIIGFCLVLTLAWLLGYSKLNQRSLDYQVLRVKVSQLSKQGESERETTIVLRNASDDIELLDNFFIKEGNDIVFIKKIENLAKIAGVTISINNLNPDSGALRMSLGAKGPFSNLYHLLLMIETLPYQVEVGGVEFSSGREVLVWEATFDLKLLNYLPKE